MAFSSGLPRARVVRRTSTVTLLATIALLLAVPTGAFAAPISVGSSQGPAPLVGPIGPSVFTGHGAPSVHPTAPSSASSSVTSGRVPLYERLSGPSARAPSSSPSGPTLLHGAVASLARGAGPAFGVPLACSSSSTTTARCSAAAAPSGSAPPAALPLDDWQNATPGAGTIDSSSVVAGAMAYDAFDQAIIYFGGCDAYACPDNQTWGYFGGYWQNLTDFYGLSASPPGVYEASMDYDYNIAEVVLFGGLGLCGSVQCPTNGTWIFSGGLWTNESGPKTCAGYGDVTCWPPAPRYGASMAFANDSADNATILFGGCLALFCLNGSAETWTWTLTYGWALLNPDGAPSVRAFASLAYDASWGALILFGGCAPSCGLADTWSWYNGQWTNESYTNSYYGFGTPTGRGLAQMTYDTQLGVLLLFGGLGDTGTNDLWGFQCGYYPYDSTYYLCGWVNDTPLVNLPGAIDLGMAASESSSIPPLVLGGVCTCTGGGATYQTYVFEPLFTGVPSLSPDPARIDQTVEFSANLTGGSIPYYTGWDTGAGYYYYGYGYSYLVAYYAYAAAGDYPVALYAYDFYGVEFSWTTLELVGNVSAQISVAHPSTEVGASDTFSTPAGSGGTAPYTYTWTFGDGATGTNADSVTHSYSETGTYTARLIVTDSFGLANTSTATVTVGPGPSVSVAASASTVDLGTALTFTPTASGGVAPYTYAWSFGGGATSTSATPSYSYPAAGTYPVSVVVTDSMGGTATASVSVVVNPAVSGTVSATPTTLTTGGAISYSAAGAGGSGTYTYTWTFGDGGKVTTATGSHTYATAGTYTATVWINDTLGGSYSHSVTVTVQSTGGGGTTSSTSGGLPGWALWAIIAFVIIVVAGLLFFVVGRRRKKENPPAAGTPTGTASPPPGTP